MGTYTWSNPNGGSFGDSLNWSPNGIPGADDSAYFNLGGGAAYTITGNGTAGYVLVYDTVTFTGTIDADQLAGTFTAFQVGDGGSAIFDGGALDSASEARIGDATGSGLLSFIDGATGTLTATSAANALDVAFADDNGVSTSGTVSVDGAGSSLTLLGGAYIGTDGDGTLTISNDGLVQLDEYASTYTDLDVGEGSTATGVVTVTSGGTLSVGEYTVIGDGGTGTMDFSDGATGDFHGTYWSGSAYEDSYALYLGGIGGSGTLSVNGTSTSVTTDEGVLIGQYGYGLLSVTNDATFSINAPIGGTFDTSYVGSSDNGTGALVVSGRAQFADNGDLVIGAEGHGSIQISSNGTVTSNAATGDVSGELGADLGSIGTGTIDHGLWDAKQSFAVGYQGDGTLTVQDNGTLEVDGAFLRVARDPGSSGTLIVNDASVTAPDALLSVGPDATSYGDGTGGNGLLQLENGSVVTADNAVIGGLSGGGGSVDVNDSSLDLGGDLSTGAGTSTLTIENSGTITVDGTVMIGGGGGIASLEITGNGALFDVGGGITLGALGTLLLDSTAYLDTANGGTTGPLVLDGGTLDVLGDGALRAPLSIDVTGGTGADPSEILGGATADVVIAGGITFGLGGTADLLLGPGFDTNNAINDFSSGDTLDVQIASGDVFDTAIYDPSTDTLTLTDTGDDDTLTLHIIDDGYNAHSFIVTPDNEGGTDITLCYLSGTRILTPTGEVPVETLRAGDRVVTRFGGIRPIRWIGRQSFAGRFLRRNRGRLPIHLRANALGEHLPARDLFVSPGHSMLIGDTLVLAEALVNGVDITQDACPDDVHYYQLDLGTHDCIVAEGTWSETFADGPGLRCQFQNHCEFEAAFPEYCPPDEIALCAPRPQDGAALDAVLRPIVARVAAQVQPGPLRGYIDAVIGERQLPGWAFDTVHPDLPVLLEVLAGDEILGSVLACDYRADLEAAGLGRGRCSFHFTSPVALTPAILSTLRVRRAADGAELIFTDAGRAALRDAA